MKSIHYPADLARVAKERWRKRRDDFRLPRLDTLARLFAVAFFSSLEAEEGRDLIFGLCCIPEGARLLHCGRSCAKEYTACEILRFEHPLPLEVETLRKLAPAVSSHLGYVLVEWKSQGRSQDALQITGIAHFGTSWTLAKKGFGEKEVDPPHSLLIDIQGRGNLTVSVGRWQIAAFSRGSVLPSQSSHMQLSELFLDIELATKAICGTANVDLSVLYMNTLYAMLNSVESKHHGGTIILADKRWVKKSADRFLKKKYRLANCAILRESFGRFWAAREKALEGLSAEERDELSDDDLLERFARSPAVGVARRALNSAVNAIAGFSGVDGAVLLGRDLVCYGFGCEILTDRTNPVDGYPVDHKGRIGKTPYNSEQRGMRHRSALRLCGAVSPRQVAAFVCSQDGGISMICRELAGEGRVLVRRIVPISFASYFPLP